MAKITGFVQKIFGKNAANIGQVGSAAAGTKVLTNNTATIQALAAFENGVSDVTITAKRLIPQEEFMALHYLHTLQNAYAQQEGIQEYNSGVTYYTNSIVKKSGTYELYGSLVDDNIGNALTDGTKWSLLTDLSSSRIKLSSNTTYYVATTGSDVTGTGLSGAPWQTTQKAIDYILGKIDLNGYAATISVANGTYTSPAVVNRPFIGGIVTIQGNVTTPANCIISTTGSDAVLVYDGAVLNVKGFKLQTTTNGSGLSAIDNGIINIVGNMDFGACAIYHMSTKTGGVIHNNGNNYTISGSTIGHAGSDRGGNIDVESNTITLSGTPNFSSGFAVSVVSSVVTFKSNIFSGTGTGPRYSVSSNSVVNTGGGGAAYFPTPTVGVSATGGQYI